VQAVLKLVRRWVLFMLALGCSHARFMILHCFLFFILPFVYQQCSMHGLVVLSIFDYFQDRDRVQLWIPEVQRPGITTTVTKATTAATTILSEQVIRTSSKPQLLYFKTSNNSARRELKRTKKNASGFASESRASVESCGAYTRALF
jgi:hypothetical protein